MAHSLDFALVSARNWSDGSAPSTVQAPSKRQWIQSTVWVVYLSVPRFKLAYRCKEQEGLFRL